MHQNITIIKNQEIKLHYSIIDCLFKYKKEISSKFNDLRGICLIDHISINILTSKNELIIFSMTPSIEYNLIIKDLWKHDKSFFPNNHTNDSLFWWDQAYSFEYASQIKEIKEISHGFSLGINIAKRIGELSLVYSFATRSLERNLKSYYLRNKKELVSIGDYGYKLIHPIYDNEIIEKTSAVANCTTLKLIIDNTKNKGLPVEFESTIRMPK